MDNAPWFDSLEMFDQRRIRLADIDGDGIHINFNQSGNSWSDANHMAEVPSTDNVKHITVVDLLGTGTACLAWSSNRIRKNSALMMPSACVSPRGRRYSGLEF